jgi:hypothetical protein
MERVSMKIPNPVTKDYDQAAYFDNTPDGGIRCIAAALTLAEDTHIIVLAPDAVILRRAWKKLSSAPLDIKKAPVVIYKYESQLEEFKKELKEGMIVSEFSVKKKDGVTTVSTVKKTSDAKPWFWYYYPHPKRGECFIEESSFVPDSKEVRLGEAKNCSEAECKLLLRANRIPRGVIDTIAIDTSIDALIPF